MNLLKHFKENKHSIFCEKERLVDFFFKLALRELWNSWNDVGPGINNSLAFSSVTLSR